MRVAGVSADAVDWLRDGWAAGGSRIDGRTDEESASDSTTAVRPSIPPALWVALCAWVVLAAWAWWTADHASADVDALTEAYGGTCRLVALQDGASNDFGAHCIMRLEGEDGRSVKVRVLYDGDIRVLAHDRIEAHLSFSEIPDHQRSRFGIEGVFVQAKASDVSVLERTGVPGILLSLRAWAQKELECVGGEGSALLSAVVLGDRTRLDACGAYEDMKAVGLAHLVAVSGAHLAVVSALVSRIALRCGVSRRGMPILIALFIVAYALCTGMQPSVVRAGLMAIVGCSSVWVRRRPSSLSSLAAAICIMLAADAYGATSLSLYLSAASTLGIIVLMPLASSWIDAALRGRFKGASDAIALTACANVLAMPANASLFYRVPLISPLSNVVAAPVFAFLVIGGMASLAVDAVFPRLGHMMLHALSYAAELFVSGVRVLSHLPYASVFCSVPLGVSAAASIGAFCALWALWPLPTRRNACICGGIMLACCLLVLAPGRFAGDRIVALDVGQGDAILVQSEGSALLVDTGNQDSRLAASLGRAGVSHLDALVITHHDDDHCGSLPMLSSVLARGEVYLAEDTFTQRDDKNKALIESARGIVGSQGVKGVEPGDVLRVGRFRCTVVGPQEFTDGGGNADSVCMLVEYDAEGDGTCEASALLTGDAEAPQIEGLIDRGLVGDIDVLKVGHHGSRAGTTEELCRELKPEYALISVGARNRYGHPTREALEALASIGCEVWRTDEDGDVSCRFTRDGIEASGMR